MKTTGALVQTRIDPAVKERAAAVLESMGLTISDAVRILLTRTANEGGLPFELTRSVSAHDLWFRAKVQEALDDLRPAVPHDEVEDLFAKRRADALKKAEILES
jgi:DNA-damage-inducible protein J